MNKRVFELGVFLPDIRIEADYDLQGKVLILPLLGNGPAKVHLGEYTVDQLDLNTLTLTVHSRTGISEIPLGRARRRWEDNIKIDLKKLEREGVDWIQLAQDWTVEGSCEHGNKP
jgi:hypothetical protein